MTIIPQDQIDKMVEVMDVILKYPYMTVGDIKKRFNLTSQEYEMIYGLVMPLVREANVKKYWAIKYKYIERKLRELLANENISNAQLRERVKALVFDPSTAEPQMFEATGLADMMEDKEAVAS